MGRRTSATFELGAETVDRCAQRAILPAEHVDHLLEFLLGELAGKRTPQLHWGRP
jgi:hypothetical protein